MKSSLKARGSRNSGENGQGFLEYSVIIVLVMIIIISFVALFGVDMFNQFIGNRARANDEQTTPTPVEPLVELSETGALAEVFETEIIRIQNCPNAGPYNPNVERKHWLEYEIELGDLLVANLRPQAISQLQALYGFNRGTSEEITLTLNLEATPNSIVDYTVNWQYIWREGDILVTQPNGRLQAYPYRARTDLGYEIVNIEQRTCEATPLP
jgi:hypothetical protein